MHAADGPLARFVDAAAETAATRHLHGKISIALLGVEGDPLARCRAESLKGLVAGHSQTNPAPHWVARHIFAVCAGSGTGELAAR